MSEYIKICGIRTIPVERKIIYLVDKNFEESYEILKTSHSFQHYDHNDIENPTVLNFLLKDGTKSVHFLKDKVDFNFLDFEPEYFIYIGLIDNENILEERLIVHNLKYPKRRYD